MDKFWHVFKSLEVFRWLLKFFGPFDNFIAYICYFSEQIFNFASNSPTFLRANISSFNVNKFIMETFINKQSRINALTMFLTSQETIF